jgi:hypothetical protein
LPIGTGIADPPPDARRRLDVSAPSAGTLSAAPSTVGTPPNTSGRKRSTRRQAFLTAFGLRQPDGDRTTSVAPAHSGANPCVSAPPT